MIWCNYFLDSELGLKITQGACMQWAPITA